jgi:hypothetical protein
VTHVEHANQVCLGGPSGRSALQDETVGLRDHEPHVFVLDEVRGRAGRYGAQIFKYA